MKRLSAGLALLLAHLATACGGGDGARQTAGDPDGGIDASSGSGGRAPGTGGAASGGRPPSSSGGATSAGGSAGAGAGGVSPEAGTGGGADSGGGGAATDGAVDGGATGDASSDASNDVSDAGDTTDGACVLDASACLGVCASTPPTCVNGVSTCTGPGFEATETSCDGFDNDCDGVVDEGCASCTLDLARIAQNLFSKWDIDFDAQCNAYLTTLVSGPDHATVVPADAQQAVRTYTGNANQNMGYGFVDPDPASHRVVVSYSCCESCNCQAKNGLTLLYTCDPDPGCGCTGQTNCPGFLDAAFLPTGTRDTSVTISGIRVATPTGLAAGPGSTYYAGNFDPETCSSAADCVACDPASPDLWCSPSRPACCHGSGPLGRIAQFTLPGATTEPEFRIVAVLPGEEVLALAASGDGSVLVGTYVSASSGRVHRLAPGGGLTLLSQLAAPAYSITEDRSRGDLYVELLGTPKIQRLGAAGGALTLPSGVPADPAGTGVLQYGPDVQLYRLVGVPNGTSSLAGYALD